MSHIINILYRLIYVFILVLLVSCNASSTFLEKDNTIEQKEIAIKAINDKVHLIDAYTYKIDIKAHGIVNFDSNQLELQGDKRPITTNESEKNIVLKNKSIVRVQYKDHLYHNFIKSKVFYYDKNELICIKVHEVLPNQFNKSTSYLRTIYIQHNIPIADSDISNIIAPSNDLVNLGIEYLKEEYSSLD